MPARWQVAFLTGQSDPQSCALSPVQRRFLDSLAAQVRSGKLGKKAAKADRPAWGP